MKKKLQNKLTRSKIKISHTWEIYREKKQKILNRRISSQKKVELINNLRTKTRSNISHVWSEYRIVKENLDESNPFKKTSEFKLKTGFEENLKLKNKSEKGFNKALKKILLKKDLRYILVTFQILILESETTINITRTLTPLALEKLSEENIYEQIIEGFLMGNSTSSDISGGYEVKNIFIRLIYENTKKGIKTKEYRKHKK